MNKENNELIISNIIYLSDLHKEKNLLQINKLSFVIIAFSVGLSTMIDLPIQLFAKDVLKIQPALMSQMIALIAIPWIIKPILGLLTDLYPIYGYRRKLYIFICSFIIIVNLLFLSFMEVNIWQTALILFILNIGFSFITVLGEAIVVELSQLEANHSNFQDNAKNLISMFFMCRYSGNLIAALLKGYLIESVGLRNVFLLSSFVGVLIFISGMILIENRIIISHKENTNTNDQDEKLLSKEKIEDSGLQNNVTFLSERNNTMLLLHKNKKHIIKEFWEFLKKKYVYIPTIFIIFYMGTPSFSSPIFYFLSNNLNFKPSDFGLISFFSNVFILLSILFYRAFLKQCNFKILITTGTFISFLVTFLSYCVVTRINLAWGISDFILCLACSSLLAGIGEIIVLPMLSLGCQICPRYLEATVYSFFMSTINLGGVISELSGSFLTNYLRITSTDFTNLPKMIIITNIISVIPLVLLLFMDDNYFHPQDNDNLKLWEESLIRESLIKDREKTLI